MKGGGLYGTPAPPASIALPVGAAVAGTAAAVGAVALLRSAVHKNYKRLPQNVRDRCNEAIDVIVSAHKEVDTNPYGVIAAEFVNDLLKARKDIRVTLDGNEGDTTIDKIIKKLKGYQPANTTPGQGEKTPPMILSRHFDTALMERANLLGTADDLKEILKLMVGKESPFQIMLIKRGGLRTTESWTRTSRGTGLQDGAKLSQERGKAWAKTQHEDTLKDLEIVLGEYYTDSLKTAFNSMENDDKIKALQNFSKFVETARSEKDHDLLEGIKELKDGEKAMSIAMIMINTDPNAVILKPTVKTVLEL